MCPTEKIKEAQTPDDMRGEINRLRRYDPIVHSMMDSADYSGLSGEDRYTCLAYYLLKQNHQLQAIALDQMMLAPAPTVICQPQ